MNIILAMLMTAFSHFAGKVWGQDIIDKAVEAVIIYAAEKYATWTHTDADDEWLALIKAKLKKGTENV